MVEKGVNFILAEESGCSTQGEKDSLIIEGARQNNLKSIHLKIPHDKVTVITGLSGSGKSSLAFDTIFAEGRWRYMESLSTYARQFLEKIDRPLVDSIRNIRPSIALEQKNPVKTARSTVGTVTELYDYLRLLYSKMGKTFCSDCGKKVEEVTLTTILESLLEEEGRRALILFPLSLKNENAVESLNELIKKGFFRIKIGDTVYTVEDGSDLNKLPLNEGNLTEVQVVLDRLVIDEKARTRLADSLEAALREGNGRVYVDLLEQEVRMFEEGFRCSDCGLIFKKPQPLLFSFNHPTGACAECKGFGNVLLYDEERVIPDKNLSLLRGAVDPWSKPGYRWWYEELLKAAPELKIDLKKPYKNLSKREKKVLFEGSGNFDGIEGFFHELESKRYKLHIRVFLSRYKGQFPCPSCRGARLRSEALRVKIEGFTISELCDKSIGELVTFFDNLTLTSFEEGISKEVLRQIKSKLQFLQRIGLDYLTLNRQTRTLSGGEAQRVSLTNQMGAQLVGTLFVLDEPSIGLHSRDTARLIDILKELSSTGNTLVIVEHDESVIRSADYIVEIGPLSGADGGHVVFAGDVDRFIKEGETITAHYARGKKKIAISKWRRKGSGKSIVIKGASENNLKNVEIGLPLHTFTCVTGVSGSGKSSLIHDTLYNTLAKKFKISFAKTPKVESIEGTDNISGVRLISQEPIGKTPRSNPVTYIGGFDEIRQFYASLKMSKKLGLTPGHFSFNVPKGRCESCKGEGHIKLEMYFMADIYVVCERCDGKRYRPAVLQVLYKGRSISDALKMTVKEAITFFPRLPELQRKLSILQEIGLDYLPLGQPATTLSGGEAQRLKIAKEMSEKKPADMLYIMDEPTTGLHKDDISKLLSALNRLIDRGNTVLIVEHNMDVIKSADFIIDLGPEGGEKGGWVIVSGTPEEVALSKISYTSRYLREVLNSQPEETHTA
jgi:excinuclease ABC subunit A